MGEQEAAGYYFVLKTQNKRIQTAVMIALAAM
jgi:hypothetical protein